MKKLAIAISLGILASFNSVYALPTGENVQSGSANFSRTADTLIIDHSGKVAIDWNSFNVGKNELVKFNQNGGIALNRIIGNDFSSIYGKIQSDGTVVLVNPNGFLFADGCVIDTGNFVASNAKLSDEFMKNFNNMNVDMEYYQDVILTYVPDENGNVVNMSGVLKADKIEIGEDGSINLTSSGNADIKGDVNTKNLTIGGHNINVENGVLNNTDDLILVAKRNLNINAPVNSTGNIMFWADFDQDYKGMISVGADIKTDKDIIFNAPTTGTYFEYESGEGKIDAPNSETKFLGNVAVNNSVLTITTKDILFTGNIDSANSYKLFENVETHGATVKDDPAMKSLAEYYYENYLKCVVYKNFEDLTAEEYIAIKDRCMDEYHDYKNRPLPKNEAEEREAVKLYFNTHVKLDGLTESTDFNDLSDDQYSQLAKHILTTFSYNHTDNRESIINNWINAVNSAKEGTNGGDAIGDKYLATITDSLENWRVTSMLEGKDYELYLGGRTDIVGESVKAGREFYWLTGIEGAKGRTKFFTSTGEGEGITHTYSAWSKDPKGIFNYVFNEPNNDAKHDQPYVAIGWHDNNGLGWADVDNSKNTMRGFVQEINNPRSTINVTLTGNHTEQGKIGDSVPITVNFNTPAVEPENPPIEEPSTEEPSNPDNPSVDEPTNPPTEEPINPDNPPSEEPANPTDEPENLPITEPETPVDEPTTPPVDEPNIPDNTPTEEPIQPDNSPIDEPNNPIEEPTNPTPEIPPVDEPSNPVEEPNNHIEELPTTEPEIPPMPESPTTEEPTTETETPTTEEPNNPIDEPSITTPETPVTEESNKPINEEPVVEHETPLTEEQVKPTIEPEIAPVVEPNTPTNEEQVNQPINKEPETSPTQEQIQPENEEPQPIIEPTQDNPTTEQEQQKVSDEDIYKEYQPKQYLGDRHKLIIEDGITVSTVKEEKRTVYGIYEVFLKDGKIRLERNDYFIESKKLMIQDKPKAIIRMIDSENEFKLVWDGAVLDIFPNNEKSKRLGDIEYIASQSLQIAYDDFELEIPRLCEICIHIF